MSGAKPSKLKPPGSRPGWGEKKTYELSLGIPPEHPYTSLGFELGQVQTLTTIDGFVNAPFVIGELQIEFDPTLEERSDFVQQEDVFLLKIAPSHRSFSLTFPIHIGKNLHHLGDVSYYFDQRTLGDGKTHRIGWRGFIKVPGAARTAQEARETLEKIRKQSEKEDKGLNLIPSIEADLKTIFEGKGHLLNHEAAESADGAELPRATNPDFAPREALMLRQVEAMERLAAATEESNRLAQAVATKRASHPSPEGNELSAYLASYIEEPDQDYTWDDIISAIDHEAFQDDRD